MGTICTTLDILGVELEAYLEYGYTPGYPADWTDPGCGPEIEWKKVINLAVRNGVDEKKKPKFDTVECPKWLAEVILAYVAECDERLRIEVEEQESNDCGYDG